MLRRPILGDEVLLVLRLAGFALMHSVVGAWAPDLRHEAFPALRRRNFGETALRLHTPDATLASYPGLRGGQVSFTS